MARVCARCHTHFEEQEGKPLVCPNCGAEAGLEPVKGTPFPMRAFAFVLVVAMCSAAGAVVWSLGT